MQKERIFQCLVDHLEICKGSS